METEEISTRAAGIRAGLLASVLLICYFMVMKYSGLIHITWLRSLNFLIQAGTIVITFRYLQGVCGRRITYLDGFAMSCIITAVSVVVFALFIFFYFRVLDPMLMEQLRNNSPLVGQYLSPYTAAASVFVEGLCSGLVITFGYMQLFQNRFAP